MSPQVVRNRKLKDLVVRFMMIKKLMELLK